MYDSGVDPVANRQTVLRSAHSIRVLTDHGWPDIRKAGGIHPGINRNSLGRIE